MKVKFLLSVAVAGLFLSSLSFPLAALAQPSCLDVITCGCEDATGTCQTFPSSCVPPGWTVVGYYDCSSAGVLVCLDVISSARNPETGECVEFPTSCTPEGWERCDGV